MDIQIKTHLQYSVPQPCDLLLQIEAADDDHQKTVSENLNVNQRSQLHRIKGDDGIGARIWLHADHEFECSYEASVSVVRQPANVTLLQQSPLSSLPNDVVKHLMPSRFCHPEQFYEFTAATFGELTGGILISEMSNWIVSKFDYVPGASDAQTTAHDTFETRKGVCRDYAHVLIAMARAVAIPARFVSAYAPDVTPQDFHAVAEVYLGEAWHLIDPTGMAKTDEIVRIGVGRDAADVSFLTSYGMVRMEQQSVEVHRLIN